MSHFQVWYALEINKVYLTFYANRKEAEEALEFYTNKPKIAELAIYLSEFPQDPIEYVGLIENEKITSILSFALANHLYEDHSNLRQVSISPITRCEKCQIMYINDTFHWSYNHPQKGRQATSPEQVLAKVCIPTAGHGDKQNIPCLAKKLYEQDLGLLQKTPAELHDFVKANNNAIEFDLPDEDYYLEMAKELLGDRPDE